MGAIERKRGFHSKAGFDKPNCDSQFSIRMTHLGLGGGGEGLDF